MWNERYNTDDYVYGTNPNDLLRDEHHRIPGLMVLSLAEGEGRNAVFLAEQGYRVTGVDGSDVGLKKAEKLAEQRGVSIETVVADLAAYPIEPKGWDAIISFFAHVPKELRRDLHRRVVAGLKPGGVFILEAFTPQQLAYGTGGPRSLDRLMALADLKEELAGLDLLIAREIERVLDEGKGHEGKGAVVQVVGLKP